MRKPLFPLKTKLFSHQTITPNSTDEDTEPSTDENEATSEIPPLAELVEMSDLEMFSHYLEESTEEEGAYYLKSSLYEDWEPTHEEGGKFIESPFDNISTAMAPYEEGVDIEKIALYLTKRYIHIMMAPGVFRNASFLITAYKDLSVEVYTRDELPEPYNQHLEPEPSDSPFTTWYVVPTISYQYIGEIDGLGSSTGEWVNDLGGEYCFSLRLYIGDESSNYSLRSAKPPEDATA